MPLYLNYNIYELSDNLIDSIFNYLYNLILNSRTLILHSNGLSILIKYNILLFNINNQYKLISETVNKI